MNVKETFLSTCEKNFINKAVSGGIRHDGRKQLGFRDLSIVFGVEFGSVNVCLGETRVLAQVTSSVQQPNSARPQDGMLCIYLELGPMAAPHFEQGRQSDLGTLTNRALEKCLKDSKVLNLESLCIRAGAKVWEVRVDINVLNCDGSLIDAASIAAIAALAHFRRPDVSVSGNDITVHSFDDKDPIPLVIQHYPVYTTYAFYEKGERIISDPTALEERVAEGQISLAVNAYKELCGLHLSGNTSVNTNLVLKCSERASKRAKYVVNLIKEKIEEDKVARDGQVVGFSECLRLNKIPSYSDDSISFKLRNYKRYLESKSKDVPMEIPSPEPVIVQIAEDTAELERDVEEEATPEVVIKPKRAKISKPRRDSESEEDEQMILEANI